MKIITSDQTGLKVFIVRIWKPVQNLFNQIRCCDLSKTFMIPLEYLNIGRIKFDASKLNFGGLISKIEKALTINSNNFPCILKGKRYKFALTGNESKDYIGITFKAIHKMGVLTRFWTSVWS